MTLPQVLTIAGSDSGGGAGIQADLKAIQANGAFAMSAITSITAQNTREVTAAHDLPVDLILAQIRAVYDDFQVAAAKTGMLSSREIVHAVAGALRERGQPNLVVDPVMVSKSGHRLLRDDAVRAVAEELLPLATVATPNLEEASDLLEREVRTADDAERAARDLVAMGPAAVLVKGGHGDGDEVVDVLFDGARIHRFAAPRIDTKNTHGTGCTLSAAIAAQLGKGRGLVEAVERAKRYVTEAIRHSLAIGGGHGPTHHFWFLSGDPTDPAAVVE